MVQANDLSRLVLGTVQLGMPYGIANTTGKPDRETARAIIKTAWERGIRIFDTAQGYGESEDVLGDALAHNGVVSEARVITKFHPSFDHANRRELLESLDISLEKLRVPELEGIFFHKEEFLDLWDNGLGEIVEEIHTLGKVAKVGISVYSPERALQALEKDGIDCVQIPTNILDHRFEQRGVFDRAEKLRKQIFIRSIYLQGLLVLNPEKLSGKMQFAKDILQKVTMIAREYDTSTQELALAYVKQSFPDAYILIGAETPQQVQENCDLWERVALPEEALQEIRTIFASTDEHILNPAQW